MGRTDAGPLVSARSARGRNAHTAEARGGLGRPPARGRRPDRPQLRRHHRPLRGGRRRQRQRSSASTRTRSWWTSATSSEGVIPSNELSIRKSVDPADEVELGEEVDALVLTKEDQDGRLHPVQEARPLREGVAAHRGRRRVRRARRGHGHRGRQGRPDHRPRRARLPARLAGRHPPRAEPRRVHGPKIECKVIELNRSRNNVVLSRRAVLEEERKEVRQQILDRLQPGQVVEGDISNIVDFGAFVDLDGIDGLIHISELSWSHVNHPSEILSIGDTVPVKVLDIDRDRQRISLGLKQTQEDPWQRVRRHLQPGRRARGQGHQGRHLRRVRRDHGRRRGPRAHLRAGPPPRGEPARGRRAGRRRAA